GPLVTNSAFCVENFMGIYVRKIETGNAIQQQIMNKSIVAASLIAISSSQSHISSIVKDFAGDIIPKLKNLSNEEGLVFQRPQSNIVLSEREKLVLRQYSDHFKSAKFYSRLKYNNFVVSVYGANSCIKTANYLIKAENNFYRITRIVHFQSINLFCILGLKYRNVINDPNDMYYISKGLFSNFSLEIVPLQNIQSICAEYSYKNILYFFEIVNRHI